MFRVNYYSHYSSCGNVFADKDFETLEEAREFASKCYKPTIYRRVPSPSYMNSLWMYEEVR